MREYAGAQPQQADGSVAVQSLDLRAADLTRELSQILDQTLAQTRVAKATPNTATTGTQFTNLVALVSTATQTQRSSHQPFTRDGLSSLSWTRPAQPIAPPPAPTPVLAPPTPSLVTAPTAAFMPPMAPAANGLLVSDPHDEEPMPIPSTWRQPTQADDDKRYRQQLGAAGLGLLAGLVVVVPAVLWLSGFLGGGSQAKTARRAGPEAATVKVAEVKSIKVASASTTLESRAAVTPPPPAAPAAAVEADPSQSQRRAAVVAPPPAVVPPPPKPVEPVRSRSEDLMLQAKRRLELSDVQGARDILQDPETLKSAPLTFLLAETYDPNMLASWQTRGVLANPERARSLYQKALDLGDARARQRLDWLRAN